MNRLQTSNLLTALAKSGQLNKTNNPNVILSDSVRDENIKRFNTVIGQLMQEKKEEEQIEKQATETYVPKTFHLKEAYEEPEVKTDAEKLLEKNGYPRALHSGHLYDGYDQKMNPKRSISISVDVIRIIVIVIIGIVLISTYMKLNNVIRELELNWARA